eukprot:NODE_18812_length_875_cov_3.962567.p1 GENE.NODE_18812_length_875_cov_3.962567~~NODE_18812_length_875_cov_3.962567.p1  ORF type:complete len:95 (-),score=3.89 NODE_18812_length_875_cov_3.962567:539-823(-)
MFAQALNGAGLCSFVEWRCAVVFVLLAHVRTPINPEVEGKIHVAGFCSFPSIGAGRHVEWPSAAAICAILTSARRELSLQRLARTVNSALRQLE